MSNMKHDRLMPEHFCTIFQRKQHTHANLPNGMEDIEMRITNGNPGFGSLFTATAALVSPAHEMITRHPLYDAVKPATERPAIVAWMIYAMTCLDGWRQRRQQRIHLDQLTDWQLEDIGIERHQIADELKKPFWR